MLPQVKDATAVLWPFFRVCLASDEADKLTLFSFGTLCTMSGHIHSPSLQRHWIVKLMPITLDMGGTFQPSLDETLEQPQPGRAGRFWSGGRCEVGSPLLEAALAGTG